MLNLKFENLATIKQCKKKICCILDLWISMKGVLLIWLVGLPKEKNIQFHSHLLVAKWKFFMHMVLKI